MSRIDIVDEENPSAPDLHDQTSANLLQDPLADASQATIPVATAAQGGRQAQEEGKEASGQATHGEGNLDGAQ